MKNWVIFAKEGTWDKVDVDYYTKITATVKLVLVAMVTKVKVSRQVCLLFFPLRKVNISPNIHLSFPIFLPSMMRFIIEMSNINTVFQKGEMLNVWDDEKLDV